VDGHFVPAANHRETIEAIREEIQWSMDTADQATCTMLHRSILFQNQHVLQLFQRDLLTGLEALLVEAEMAKDAETLSALPWPVHVAGWSTLLLMLSGMLFYVFLFGVIQNIHQQRAWTQSFGLWLLMEILLISTVLVLVSDVWLPMMLVDGVARCNNKLLEVIGQMSAMKDDDFMLVSPTMRFNAVEFFFASHRVASRFPSLLTSQAVLQFRTPWPRQSYGALRRMQNTRWWSWVTNVPELMISLAMMLLSLFSAAPQQVQSLTIEVLLSGGMGFVVGVHVLLYRVYPVLVVLPAVTGASIFFLLRYWFGRSSAVVPLEGTRQPEGQATGKPVSETETHVGRRASIQAGVALLQDMQNVVENDHDYYSVSSDTSNDEVEESSAMNHSVTDILQYEIIV
jgi:hypothetical protein